MVTLGAINSRRGHNRWFWVLVISFFDLGAGLSELFSL